MTFNPEKCYIPTVYCGDQEMKYPYIDKDNNYVAKGTSYQCMKKGFGAAMAQSSRKNLPVDSLQNIRYVGPKFDQAFKDNNIHSTKQLIDYVRKNSARQINELFKRVFNNSNNTLNGRGFNSTLLWLYRNGNSRLPQCVEIS